MYNSPIEMLITDIQHQIVKQQDEEIYKAVMHFVPNIDKEELIRALQYDRNQYDKGYADGKADAMAELVRCKDCKYAMDMMPIENSGGCLMGECTLRKEDDIVFTAWGDEFCSYGEMKDNG